MVHYKLIYFNSRGYAETARQLFALAEVEYEDIRFEHQGPEWPKLKPNTPFGQVPLLEVDGKQIPQSLAITRYLANKFGYAGKSDEDKAWADAFADQIKDLIILFGPYHIAKHAGKSADELSAILKDSVRPGLEQFYTIIAKYLKQSKSGFLLDSGITYPDLILAELTTIIDNVDPIDKSKHPELFEHQNKVRSIPQIKKWIEKRPVTEN
ncbi:unnamed protein product [Caenorhabditis auriculariae]|uniref:glutathione transferase n=1 Tax=Caenorhabditis auriculariae TaxID=2777116 RepID=A0A8S1HKD3_9PELO|nr:unnamed protein product [Caenorhabditis auriculariae]